MTQLVQTYSLLPGLFYYEDFITPTTEEVLLEEISKRPHAWKHLKNRKLQNWGGLPHIKGMLSTPLPSFLQSIIHRLMEIEIFPKEKQPNHVLINHYAPGQGIDPHVDGPVYYPIAAIISLQSSLVMDFFNTPSHRIASLILKPRSLLILSADTYHHFQHAISHRSSDIIDQLTLNSNSQHPIGSILQREDRTSLTIRASCKTIKSSLLGKSTTLFGKG